MKTIHVSDDYEEQVIEVNFGEIVKVVNGDKSVIAMYIGSGSRHCSYCCFNRSESGLCQLGLHSCMNIPIMCMGGYYKMLDSVMESL